MTGPKKYRYKKITRVDWDELLKNVEGDSLQEKLKCLLSIHGSYAAIGRALKITTSSVEFKFRVAFGDSQAVREYFIKWDMIFEEVPGDSLKEKFVYCLEKYGTVSRVAGEFGIRMQTLLSKMKSVGAYKAKHTVETPKKDREFYDYKSDLEEYLSEFGDVKEIQAELRKNPVSTPLELEQFLNSYKNNRPSPE